MMLAAAGAAALAGCVVGPDYKRPEVAAPEAYRFQPGPAEAASIADVAWWGVFGDKALQGLITDALAGSYDLKIAAARIEQARELVPVARSQGLPEVGYKGYAQGANSIGVGPNTVNSVDYGTFGGLLNAAWEPDIWGRVKRSAEAAEANLQGQEYVRRGVMLTLVSDLAAGYFRLIELDRELAIAEESVATYKKTLDLFTYRFQAGRDSELPVARTQADYEASRAYVSTLKREIAQQEDALSILAGRAPGPIARGAPLTAQVTPQTPLGATTDLLKRRPDILAAEQAMVGANAEIGVAEANFYPRLGLSALAGGEGVAVGGGTHGFGLWNAALEASGPIFTGGRLEAIYRQRKAFWDETVAQYHKTIQVAFQETSDALIAQQTLVKRRENLQAQTQSLRRSLDLALLRYDAGRANYFEVLEAEQQLYPAEYDLARTQQDQLIAVVNLYKALGGGWNLTPAQWSQPQ